MPICKRGPEDLKAKNLKSKRYYIDLCVEAAKEFSIANVERVENLTNFNTSGPSSADRYKDEKIIVDLDFAMKVNELLPPQPWKPGVHRKVTKQLKCTNKEYFQSVQILIEEGLRNKQVDGVVYDEEGNVIVFDPERVDPETLELLEQ